MADVALSYDTSHTRNVGNHRTGSLSHPLLGSQAELFQALTADTARANDGTLTGTADRGSVFQKHPKEIAMAMNWQLRQQEHLRDRHLDGEVQDHATHADIGQLQAPTAGLGQACQTTEIIVYVALLCLCLGITVLAAWQLYKGCSTKDFAFGKDQSPI